MHPFLRVAAALAAMSESPPGGGGAGNPRDDELNRLREENARLRGDRIATDERPPEEVRRAAREQELRGPAQPDTDAARQMRAEQRGRQDVVEERKKRTGDDATRELIRIVQGSVQFHQAGSETAQRELDALRVDLGDEELGAHVALRDYQRALANHNAHPATPAGNIAHAAEVERTRQALEANPLAKQRLEAIERARRQGAPVDFTAETEGEPR